MARILIALDVPDGVGYGPDDLQMGVVARLQEFYPHGSTPVVPSQIRAVVTGEAEAQLFFQAASVGLEGRDESEDGVSAAYDILDALHGVK